MNLPFFIAKRYAFTFKKANFIQVITGISFVGAFMSTAALVVVLSVFNGLEDFVAGMVSKFDPELKIEIVEGKSFELNKNLVDKLNKTVGIAAYSFVLEENVYLKYGDKDAIAFIKGVDSAYANVNSIEEAVYYGTYSLKGENNEPYVVLGSGLAATLEISLNNPFNVLQVFVPTTEKFNALKPEKAFAQKNVVPVGNFDIQNEINSQYLIADLTFCQELLHVPNKASAVELKLKPGYDLIKIHNHLSDTLGKGYVVKNRYQQKETLYKIFLVEKWSSFFILSFIAFIAALSLVSSLTMTIIDKKQDIAILNSLGVNDKAIGHIFLLEGAIITLAGTVVGCALGTALVLLQQHFGFVKFNAQSDFLVPAYPVALRWLDIVLVFIAVNIIGVLCAYFPAKRAATEINVPDNA